METCNFCPTLHRSVGQSGGPASGAGAFFKTRRPCGGGPAFPPAGPPCKLIRNEECFLNQTANYQLCQWDPTDRILMEDFNTDNSKIDAALKAQADTLESLSQKAGGRLLGTLKASASGTTCEFRLDGLDWSAWREVHLVADPYTDSGAVVTVYACGSNAVMCVLSGNTSADRAQHASLGHMVLYPLFDPRNRATVIDLCEGEMRDVGYQFSNLTYVRMIVNNGHTLKAGTALEIWGAK